MRRIALWALIGAGLTPALGQGTDDAAAVVLSVRDGAFAVIDMSVPGTVGGTEVDRDLRELERWTGWVLGQPTVKSGAGMTSAQARIVSGGQLTGPLSDAIWPIVAALARHGTVSITVIGATVSTAPLTIDNRYVHLEQSGGQGVQSYQARIKDPTFGNTEELKRPAGPGSSERTRAGGVGIVGAWMLLVVASLAVGVAVYLVSRGFRQSATRTARAGRR